MKFGHGDVLNIVPHLLTFDCQSQYTVTSTRLNIHFGASNASILGALSQNIERFSAIGDITLGNPFKEDPLFEVFSHLKVSSSRVELQKLEFSHL